MKWFEELGKPAPDDERNIEQEFKDGRKVKPFVLETEEGSAVKFVRSRWDRLEKDMRKKAAELKVNFLRYYGQSWVQVHPRNPNQLYFPGGPNRHNPTINKIKRGVQRYVAQVTADEPIIDAMPARYTDEARDAAEAATHAIRGEWDRLNLHQEMQRAVLWSAIMRSGFMLLEWDPNAGEEEPAQKFFKGEDGQDKLKYVDKSGQEVGSASEAATIRDGNICVKVGTPFNVRFTEGRSSSDAAEVMWAEMPTLREVYEAYPDTRKYRVSDVLGDHPPDGEKWLEDLRGESYAGSRERDIDEFYDEATGDDLEDEDSILDERVFLLQYFRARGATYKNGAHVILAGKVLVKRGPLRYGVIPVVQFKALDDPSDVLGEGIVDLLRDPQELLDFVNTQILRYLQMLRRRWFVPVGSLVKPGDLNSPTTSIIEFNPAAGAPVPENAPEIPNSLVEWTERFGVEFDDQLGIHDIMQGKHVPGVQSGRHAEALRSGDETLLGLTRTQMERAISHLGVIILKMISKEWKRERRVRYFGPSRTYVDKSFSGADFGDTSTVRLKKGTLLMLTPAQKLETLFAYAEMQILSPNELRELAPLADTTGVNLSEDQHYIRARRQNEIFLAGPPKELMAAREKYETQIENLSNQMQQFAMMGELATSTDDKSDVSIAVERVQANIQEVEEEWLSAMQPYMATHEAWEDDMQICKIHAVEHSKALASQKAESLPPWWVENFSAHATTEWEIGNPEQVQMRLQLTQMQAQAQQPVAPPAEGM